MTGADETRFWTAVTTGDAATVEALVRADSQFATARRAGVSAILLAKYHHTPEVVACLRRHVATLDIFEASALGEGDRVGALLDSDPGLANAVAGDGFGPLGLASFFGHEPVLRQLLEHGAKVDEASSNDMRVMPLHSAAAARSVPIARLLLEHGAPVNARQGRGSLGFTPLMEAAFNGQADMVETLLGHGADPGLRDEEGRSAADHARARGHAAVAERLEGAAWS
ncbi:MAG TPA: ankyrin repeat domain-containing protein [Candidatus Acidoferrales bacterium]|nr:ankyrin repeat domain-containing protein [Candidatus Acidoferrales bacterium]